MISFRNVGKFIAAAAVTFTLAAAANAQTRVFVSSAGNDANACTLTSPCRSFQRGHDVAAAGGEVIALNGAGYGAVNITKPVTISGSEVYAGITVSAGGTGVTVNPGAGLLVVLRNLEIDGNSAGTNTGVNYVSGGLVIQNCQFRRLQTGLNVTNGKIQVIDSDFKGNGTAINATGTGLDPLNAEPSTTLVLVRGGNIVSNTTGTTQNDAGLNGSLNPKTNILMFAAGAQFTNLVGNTTNSSCTGAGCQSQPGTYGFNQTMN